MLPVHTQANSQNKFKRAKAKFVFSCTLVLMKTEVVDEDNEGKHSSRLHL